VLNDSGFSKTPSFGKVAGKKNECGATKPEDWVTFWMVSEINFTGVDAEQRS
jgi:hypothetical protein